MYSFNHCLSSTYHIRHWSTKQDVLVTVCFGWVFTLDSVLVKCSCSEFSVENSDIYFPA